MSSSMGLICEGNMTDQPQGEPTAAIWAARRERARRWTLADLKGYPTVSLEAETEETLAADPPPVERRRKRQQIEGGEPTE